jgi:hypothetical protein
MLPSIVAWLFLVWPPVSGVVASSGVAPVSVVVVSGVTLDPGVVISDVTLILALLFRVWPSILVCLFLMRSLFLARLLLVCP